MSSAYEQKFQRFFRVFRTLLLMSVFLALFFSQPVGIFAQSSSENTEQTDEHFSISLESSYSVNAVGKTVVEQKFIITNKTPEYFVSNYGISLSSTQLSNLHVTSDGQSLTPETNTQDGRTTIKVNFPDQILGEGKKRELVISYVDSDIAQISGKVLEVNIPKLADHYQYSSYKVTLRVPSIFGNPTRINPTNFTLKQDGDFNVIEYSQLAEQAVSAFFGSEQIFDLKLSYHLENPSSQAALSQITLPPDLPNQEVYYFSLNPEPQSIKTDADGNYIATYEIPASSKLDVSLLAKIRLFLNAQNNQAEQTVLPAYTSALKYWDFTEGKLKNLNGQFHSAEEIFNFTVDSLNYTRLPLDQDFPRLGAAAALEEQNTSNATCQEFTDLFIALARQANIPSRRLVGYAYSNNPDLRPVNIDHDVLHSWPEYYDEKSRMWIQVDPTWEDTTGGVDYFNKFDLNHIVFAINGLSSTMPYPAGSYLNNGSDTGKKVVVDFSSEEFPEVAAQLTLALEQKNISGIAVPGSYLLTITNQTGKAWQIATWQLKSSQLDLEYDSENLPDRILPFASLQIPVMVYNQEGLIGQSDTLQASIQLVDGQSFAENFDISGASKFQFQLPEPKVLMAVGAGILIVTFTTWGLFLLGRAGANSLRRKSQKLEKETQKLQQISTSLRKNQENGQSGSGSPLPGSGERAGSTADRSGTHPGTPTTL